MKALIGRRLGLLLVICSLLACIPLASVFAGADSYAAGAAGLDPQQQQGRDTWYFWTGGDSDSAGNVVGDQSLWRTLAIQSRGTVDLLQAVDSRMRNERFKRFGVINDPDCTPATEPDRYGLWLDTCSGDRPAGPVGDSAGIVGLRRFANPKFNPAAWSLEQYLADPAKVEPPYLIGVACAFCHVGPSPLHPPADPEHPAWRNLNAAIGNQFFREQLFNTAKFDPARSLQPSDFRWQVAHAEPAGTSDTSQVATDHIDNPGAINNIAYLNYRPKHPEVTADGVTRHVFHVLKDGADSVGSACLDDPTERPGINDTACAALRGYINIGLCAPVWTTLQDPVYGLKRAQEPFNIARARQASPACDESWTATQSRLEGLEAFLRTMQPLHLADAEGGAGYLSRDPVVLAQGKQVFADTCARCHSSKQPPAGASATDWFRQAVQRDDFLDANYLSDDVKYPASEIGTNSQRALATNARRGQIWQAFSSETYKQAAPVRISGLRDPLHPSLPWPGITATGGAGYYRTPTLANIWATAPFLHNNSVGVYNADPSVAGRLAAYKSAMEQLLWPSRRAGNRSIHRTTQASRLDVPEAGTLCIPANTPIDLITNLHRKPGKQPHPGPLAARILCGVTSAHLLNPLFLLQDNAPDFVEDRGHTYGAQLTDLQKLALIEYMKYF